MSGILGTWGGDAYGSTEYEAHRLCETCGSRVRHAGEVRCDGCIYGIAPGDPEHRAEENESPSRQRGANPKEGT